MVGTRKRKWLRASIGGFVQQYERKAQRGVEPNDRGYDRKVETEVKRMDPFELDELLNGDNGEVIQAHNSTQVPKVLATVSIVGWPKGMALSSGWGEHAFAQFRKELRRSVSLSLASRREIEREVRARKLVVIHSVQPRAAHGLRLILQALGAEVAVDELGSQHGR